MKAWVKQRSKDIERKGKKKTPWVVFWNDPDNGKRKEKSCGPGKEGWRLAQKELQRIHGEIISGTYGSSTGGTWIEFREKYEQHIAGRVSGHSVALIRASLLRFEKFTKPGKMSAISTFAIDKFKAARRQDRGSKKGATLSPATVNKDLRNLKAALRKACKWGFLPVMPDVEFEREPEHEPVFLTPEHFKDIYKACDSARLPLDLPYSAADWWRALLVTTYMTGWRIGETLKLRKTDLDLNAGTAKLRAETTKGKRDVRVTLHPVVVEHLKRIESFNDMVFPWLNNHRTLYTEFHRIQEAAGIHLPCDGNHEHTPACHLYGFHDERRAFATLNAGKLSGDVLQALMRHKSYQTTQGYINMADRLETSVEELHVPDVLLSGKVG